MTQIVNEILAEEDKCDECGKELANEDFYGEYEDRGEFWGAPCSEYVTYGYKCPGCGHKEEF